MFCGLINVEKAHWPALDQKVEYKEWSLQFSQDALDRETRISFL